MSSTLSLGPFGYQVFGINAGPEPADSTTIAYEQDVAANEPAGPIYIDVLLNDREPPPEEPPAEEAEIRIGGTASFQQDQRVGDYTYQPNAIVQPREWADYFFGGPKIAITPNDSTPDDPLDPDTPLTTATIEEALEVARQTETVRVYMNNDENTGVYVDIERIINVAFELPARLGPTGKIRQFLRLNLNWGRNGG